MNNELKCTHKCLQVLKKSMPQDITHVNVLMSVVSQKQ